MLTFRDIPNSNVVEFTVDGHITRDEFDAVRTVLDRKIADYGSVAVLEEIRDIGKIPPSVLWEDLKWVFRHLKQVSQAAVVCDADWVEKLVEVMRPLVTAEVRHFGLDEIDEARDWLADTVD
ncbi:MAG: STAS/SEC14 domain-containing protein [Woeseiaceae bacterium]|nr:STAS/SEC14 domain-containing protein [Woeseiaceae bacterium]